MLSYQAELQSYSWEPREGSVSPSQIKCSISVATGPNIIKESVKEGRGRKREDADASRDVAREIITKAWL